MTDREKQQAEDIRRQCRLLEACADMYVSSTHNVEVVLKYIQL